MKASTTSSNYKTVLTRIAAVLFWLLLWEIGARLVDVRYLFPTVTDIILSLFRNVATGDFWLTVLLTILRITLGFVFGIIIAVATALLCTNKVVHALVSPLITVIRCTPVASFIMIMWLLLSDPVIPTVIALLMVFPVVWQNAFDAIKNPPTDLAEVADVYGFSKKKRLLYLTVPTMLKGTLPSIITASGLAWKAGVAAEIITYTESSVGRNISVAKNYLEGADMFAWTVVVVALSLAVEAIVKHYSGKAAKIWEY